MMQLCVYGLYHLGSVTAACLAEAGFQVVGIDDNAEVIRNLQHGILPVYEPGLAELIAQGIKQGRLSFTDQISAASKADIVWITYDTPVDEDDRADVGYVTSRVKNLFGHLKRQAIVLVSSQLPVGTIDELEKAYRAQHADGEAQFACSPENLRLGSAIHAFKSQARVVVGCKPETKPRLETLMKVFCDHIVWMSIPSAEMTKHAVNSYLAMSIVWINEMATLCEQTGADASQVEEALRLEPRIGAKAYVRAGASFGGGTLARDVRFLQQLNPALPLMGSIIASNARHADWPIQALERAIGGLSGRLIAVLGIAYKPGTSSIRRSMALRWCDYLLRQGAVVRGYDPQVNKWPQAPAGFSLCATMDEAIAGADALIIATEWEEFKSLSAEKLISAMRTPRVIDQGRFLARALASHDAIQYISVGRQG